MVDETHNEQTEGGSSKRPTWFERLSDILLGEPQDRAQLIDLLRDAEQRQLLDHEALRMIEGVLHISEMHVRDIMVPRSQMVIVDAQSPLDEIVTPIIESGHSRFPVIGESRDEVLGILLAKDLLRLAITKPESVSLTNLLRPALFIPESKRLDVLLREFRQKFTHIAIVVDEYGGVSGLVTIEDVLEQIVGDIEDEYDTDEEDNIKDLPNGACQVKAITPIEEFNEHFGSEFSDEEFDTIGGLVTDLFGRLPKVDEVVVHDKFEFKIIAGDNRRLRLLSVTKIG